VLLLRGGDDMDLRNGEDCARQGCCATIKLYINWKIVGLVDVMTKVDF
jgi:hypothetical protein